MNRANYYLKTLLILVFFFSTLGTMTPALADSICPKLLSGGPLSAEDLNAAAKFAEKKNGLLKAKQFWDHFMGRMTTETEFRRAKIADLLRTQLHFDRPYAVVKYLEPMTMDIRLAYHLIVADEELLKGLKAAGNTPAVRATTQEILTKAKVIARGIDDYGSAFGMLQKISEESSGSADAAKLALEKLKSEYILKTFFKQSGITATDTPVLRDLYQVLERYPEADLARLRQDLRREAFSALLSVSPTESAFASIGKWAARTPGVDEKSVLSFLATLQDVKIRRQYFPNIQLVVDGAGTDAEKLERLESFNASTDNELMITFARRVDVQDLWNRLKEVAKARTDQRCFNKMAAAEELSSKLGDLSLLNDNMGMRVVARFLDAALASGLGYLMVDIVTPSKAPELTPAEEKQVDKTLGDVQKSAEKMHEIRK